jgi:4,5-dihydroxyphthalate decarboxylase
VDGSVTAAVRSWHALLGEYPGTRALRDGRVESALLRLEFADVAVPNKAFKRVVRDLEFDVAELALMTFLMARARGVPLRLLPIALFSRNPLRYLVCRADGGRLHPRGLAGRSIAARSYTTTTAVWARALLVDQFDIDLDQLRWLTCEEGHVAGLSDPPNVQCDPGHADLVGMLLDGVVDAAIVDPVPDDRRLTTVVPNPDAPWRAWQARTGARTINHVVVVRESLAGSTTHMRELFRLFQDSQALAGPAANGAISGFDGMARSLEVAAATAAAQHLLPHPLSIDDVMTGTLASLT